MKNISKIKNLSLFIFIIPLVAINLCLIIVIYFNLEPGSNLAAPTFPYFDGGASISRTARVYPSYLIFKPSMFLTAFLLISYWRSNFLLFEKLDPYSNYKKYFKFFGIASAIFLILHSTFLGIKYDISIYKFFRRFVLLSFIIFELVAQTLLVINLNKIKGKIDNIISKNVLKKLIDSLIDLTVLFIENFERTLAEAWQ